MKKTVSKISKKRGKPPGTLVHIGDRKVNQTEIQKILYNQKEINIETIKEHKKTITDCPPRLKCWIEVTGIHDIEVIKTLGTNYDIHPLVLEDILNTHQRSKIDEWEKYIYAVVKTLHFDEKNNTIDTEQLSIIIADKQLITFQEGEKKDYLPIIDRLLSEKGKIRSLGTDYLFYAIVDSVVDNYFTILEQIGESIEKLDQEVLDKPDKETTDAIHLMKKEMAYFHRVTWHMQEAVNTILHREYALISDDSLVYFRDVHDHLVRISESIDLYREFLASILEAYNSGINNRMSEVMKLLTIISTIFIPLSFIAGYFGMNFKYLPGTHNPRGYLITLLVMAGIAVVMVLVFKKKKWL